MIKDRNGQPLAISSPVASIWVNPKHFSLDDPKIGFLCQLLNIPRQKLQQELKAAHNRGFFYISRGVSPAMAEKIKSLAIPGVYERREFRRFYPEAEVMAHVLGFTNIDDQGQEGLELAFNSWLQGIPGKKRVIKDRLGRIIADVNIIRPPQSGKDLILSIDRRLQFVAYRELTETLEKNQAHSGSVIVLDPHTGEILAMVTLPSYNPNERYRRRDSTYRNRSVTDVFEPGSVIKAFSITTGLLSGKYTPDTLINTNPGWMVVGSHRINEDKNHNYGLLTVTDVLKHSSNVGVSKMVLSIPPVSLISVLKAVGFGQRTATGFPGEGSGMINPEQVKRPFDLATLSFGYGLTVTPLQLAQAYGVFATSGKLTPASLLLQTGEVNQKQVLPPKIADQMLEILHHVLDDGGTGISARVAGYQVAGKTGTARVASTGGYEKDKHIATFVGIAPKTRPRLVVVAVVQEPEKQYYAAQVSSPLFSKVMSGCLRVLNIPPDDIAVAQNAK